MIIEIKTPIASGYSNILICLVRRSATINAVDL